MARNPTPKRGTTRRGPDRRIGADRRATQAQAVRNAIGEGLDDLGDIEAFVKSQYGLDIPRQILSAYKSQIKSKLISGKAVRGRKPKAADSSGPAPRAARQNDSDGDLLEALEAVKPLVDKLGADKVHRLIDLLK